MQQYVIPPPHSFYSCWLVDVWLVDENNNLQFLGKNMFVLQQVVSFLNIMIKKWIILGLTVIYILILVKCS